jgi:hypothetical protein
MGRNDMRRRCERIVGELDLTPPFDVFELCDQLAERRGRPIYLTALSLPPNSPCGLFASTARVDAIFYQKDTSRLHQQHIIAHEIGHLLCSHEAAPVLEESVMRVLMPDLEPSLIQQMLGRTAYGAVEEQEAETIASLISRAANLPVARHEPAPSADIAGVLDRLEHSLGNPQHRQR